MDHPTDAENPVTVNGDSGEQRRTTPPTDRPADDRLRQWLPVLNSTYRSLLSDQPPSFTLESVCAILAASEPFRAAWVVIPYSDDHPSPIASSQVPPCPTRRPSADAGGHLETVLPPCAESAIRNGQPVVIDPRNSAFPCPEGVDCERFQGKPTLAIPLGSGTKPFGAMVLHSEGEWRFDQSERNLVRDLGETVTLSLTKQSRTAVSRKIDALLALHETSVDLARQRDIKSLLRTIVVRAGKLVGTDAGGLYLSIPHGLQMVVARGLLEPYINRILPLGEGASGLAVETRQAILINDYNRWNERSPIFEEIQVGSVIAAPLLWQDTVLGAFHVEHPVPNTFTQDDVEIVSLFAKQAAVAIANARLIYSTETSKKELELAYTATLEGWVRALDLRDQETEGHTKRVTELTIALAGRLDLPEDQLEWVRRGALLHDIGKIGIPDAILRKPGPLTAEEWTIMRRHPQMAWDMLSPIEYLRPALAIPYGHHERWNGSGYPMGLKGRHIPLAARIFAVVDVYDALKSDRPYRTGWPEDRTRSYLRRHAGIDFDPEIVETFLEMLAER